MEISFENNDSVSQQQESLSQQQRQRFYEKMKDVVVLIEAARKSRPLSTPSRGKSSSYVCGEDRIDPNFPVGTVLQVGTGVILDSDGLILTCAHVIPVEANLITLRRVKETEFWTARVVDRNEPHDLCLLRVIRGKEEVVNFDFAKFGDSIDIGMDVLTICHTQSLFYTLMMGQVAFECGFDDEGEGDESPRSKTPKCRKVGEIIDPEIDQDLKSYYKNLRVIQINNFHGGGGTSGAPVFDSRGRVIGLSSFILKNFDFAIHFSVCRRFFQDSLVKLHTKRMPSDKRSRKRNMKRKREFGDGRRDRKKRGPFSHGDKGKIC